VVERETGPAGSPCSVVVFERKFGRPTIIDWKSYEVGGDTDARLQTAVYGWALWRSKFYDISTPESIELLECQVQDGVVIKHECSRYVFDEVEDYIYRSLHRIFSLCHSKKLSEARLQDFAFTDNPNSCEHCVFRRLCVERSAAPVEEAPKRATRKKGPRAVQDSLF
jgi:PD-(D/E)XK nuclease superfamily